jgi:hypothetical protein
VTRCQIPEELSPHHAAVRTQDLLAINFPENTCTVEFFLFACFYGRAWQATDVPQPSWLFVPPALDVPTLATRCLRAYRRVPHSSGGSWTLWAENEDRQFSLKCRLPRYILGIFYMPQICDMGTHGFTSLPKEGVLKIFPPLKIRRLRPGLNPRTWYCGVTLLFRLQQ